VRDVHKKLFLREDTVNNAAGGREVINSTEFANRINNPTGEKVRLTAKDDKMRKRVEEERSPSQLVRVHQEVNA